MSMAFEGNGPEIRGAHHEGFARGSGRINVAADITLTKEGR